MQRAAALILPIALASFASAAAQTPDTSRKATPLAAVTITATRTQRSTFDTPQPITVLDSAQLAAKLPNSPIDVFRDVPGLDASGVGPNQRRPEIRGQRGQRILLLENGLRLNNSRRQQDFGEIPALAGINTVQRVEVVRGPSSVLYGTDAIGGVVNLLSAPVPRTPSGEIHGDLMYRYGSAGNTSTPTGDLAGHFGRFGFRANVAYRDASQYQAPAGSFGAITLDSATNVFDTGVRDRSSEVLLGYDLTPTSEVFTRAEFYASRHAGFGWVDPSQLGPGQPTIQILYPDQDDSRYTVGYRASALSNVFANRAEVSVYTQGNKRHLNTFVNVPAGPGAFVDSKAYNYTNLGTLGGRLELARVFGKGVLTYGLDAFRDGSNNTDSSRTVITGFGPPMTFTSTTPNVPNATFRSAGAFAQVEVDPVSRLTTVLGVRGQDVVAETRETPGLTAPLEKGHDRTVVWSANALYRLTHDVNLVTAVGRGFRAPNLIERFFTGSASEGNGYQTANPDLHPETSLNVDVGARVRHGPWYAESFVFRNDIHDAIKAVPTGNTVNGQPEYQEQNIDRLRMDGLELATGVTVLRGVDASASWTRLIGRNVSDPNNPIGDSYSSKLLGDVAWQPASGRFTVGYTIRHQGAQKDVIVGTNPIGTVIPAFTVHSARASARLFDRAGVSNSLMLAVDNIGNKLYAEFPNASFFRPEPGRSVSLAIVSAF